MHGGNRFKKKEKERGPSSLKEKGITASKGSRTFIAGKKNNVGGRGEGATYKARLEKEKKDSVKGGWGGGGEFTRRKNEKERR